MNLKSGGWLAIFTFLGILCGLALATLIQPGEAAAQAPQPTRAAGGNSTGGAGGILVGQQLPQNVDPSAKVASPQNILQPSALASKAFTYQGLLRSGGAPVNGNCDFQFSVWDALNLGAQLGSTQTLTSTVTNGLFTVVLNGANQFGNAAFDGRAVWIETSVRCPSGAGSYATLTPRQALTAAPLASGLAPHALLNANDTYSGNAAMTIRAPVGNASNPMGLEVHADPSNYIGIFSAVGVWADSGTGLGIWGTTSTGVGVKGSASGAGQAGYFDGDVTVTGKLNSRFKVTQVINAIGGLPKTSSSFTTSGGTLLLFYSGSGFADIAGAMIGMIVKLDGNFIDQTGIYANANLTHLAFVPKQWIVSGIAAGTHTITLEKMSGNTNSDFNDIFEVVVTEMPN